MNDLKDTSQKLCVIWMHGLGADATDMQGLASYLRLPQKELFHHVFINAPMRPVTINNNRVMRAWYDITGFDLTHREDTVGINASVQQIHAAINDQIQAGFDHNRIVLAGFSQGGAMALLAGLTYEQPLASLMAFSGYLPMARQIKMIQPLNMSVFMGFGQQDNVVFPEWSKFSANYLEDAGYHVTLKGYEGMGHGICDKEMQDISAWLTDVFEKRV